MSSSGTPAMRLFITPDFFVLQTRHLQKQAQLVIERLTREIICTSYFNPTLHSQGDIDLQCIDVFFIFGIVPISNVSFLVLVTGADVIGSLNEFFVYEIKDVEFIPLDNAAVYDERVEAVARNIEKLLISGFYFSYHYDLTNPSQRSSGNPATLHEKADTDYYWNYKALKSFICKEVHPQWLIPTIQGYVGIRECHHEGKKLSLSIVSRRSCLRTGTRYNCRGIDEQGNTANFVETEQILMIDSKRFSFVQVRGSVPVF